MSTISPPPSQSSARGNRAITDNHSSPLSTLMAFNTGYSVTRVGSAARYDWARGVHVATQSAWLAVCFLCYLCPLAASQFAGVALCDKRITGVTGTEGIG